MKPQIITGVGITTLEELQKATKQLEAKWQVRHDTPIDDKIVVLDRDFCNQHFNDFSHIIHIWRQDYPQNSCQFHQPANGNSLTIHYKDGEALTNEIMCEVETFVNSFRDNNGTKQLLVHCAAGLTRSPTIALLCASLLYRQHPSKIIGSILREMRVCRGLTPNICHKPLECICQFVEARGIEL